MNTNRLLVRLPVVFLSLALLGGYVYVRAGGRLPSWRAPSPEPAAVTQGLQPTGFDSLPGSKSAMGFFPDKKGAANVNAAASTANTNVSAQQSASVNASTSSADQLIYGSKSAPVFLPVEAVQPPPQLMLPGSKSDVLISPADIPRASGNSAQRQQR
jgi:hypothetical protein